MDHKEGDDENVGFLDRETGSVEKRAKTLGWRGGTDGEFYFMTLCQTPGAGVRK